jgi:hypothetical protein
VRRASVNRRRASRRRRTTPQRKIETSRGGRVPERVTYVLLNVGGMWLVDSKTRNGLKATL